MFLRTRISMFYLCYVGFFLCFFFFFQAEDGIRDGRVTGVQTCALPIFVPLGYLVERFEGGKNIQAGDEGASDLRVLKISAVTSGHYVESESKPVPARSEERRVGKECRSRWWPYH